jgi:hypothetical protein
VRYFPTFVTPTASTHFFRFRLEDMIRLMHCLSIPAYFCLDNGSVVNGQEGMMVMLIDIEDFFGWELTRLCRIKNWMLDFVYRTLKHRVQDYLHWHVRYVEECKAAMQDFKRSLSLTGTLAHRTRNVSSASVCRSSQPAGQQVGGPQPNMDLQCLVCNHWKKVHNILFQLCFCLYMIQLYTHTYADALSPLSRT